MTLRLKKVTMYVFYKGMVILLSVYSWYSMLDSSFQLFELD